MAVFAILPVKRDAREIDRPLAFPAPVERDALAFPRVEAFEAVDGRAEPVRAEAAEAVGVEPRVEIFAGQPQLVAVGGVIDDARERGVRTAVLRVGARARRPDAIRGAETALILQLLVIAARIGRHHRPVAAAPREDRGFAEFLVGAAVARAEEAADILAGFEEVGGIGGDEADRAGKAVAAVERRRRAAQNLDRFHETKVDIIAATRCLRTETEAVGNAHAVDLDQHAVAADAADVEAVVTRAAGRAERGAEACGLALDADAGFETDEVADVGDHLVGDLLVALDRHSDRNVLGLHRRARRGDDDLVLAGNPIVAVIVLRKGRGSGGGERKAQRGACGEAECGRTAIDVQFSSPE